MMSHNSVCILYAKLNSIAIWLVAVLDSISQRASGKI